MLRLEWTGQAGRVNGDGCGYVPVQIKWFVRTAPAGLAAKDSAVLIMSRCWIGSKVRCKAVVLV